MSLLEVDGLSIAYGDTQAVSGLSFALDDGESLGLVGESGSGKTQTALALLGLLPRAATLGGDVRLDGESLIDAPDSRLNRLRARRIAIVFQDPAQALNPYLTIGQQVGRILLEHRLAAEGEIKARVVDMLDRVGLPDPERQYSSHPHQLSGGMRQRAMIAAALIAKPALLIADEPTTALDVTVQAQILDLLETLRDDTALLLITHDLGIVANHCERMLVLERGRQVETGPTRQLFLSPEHPHTERLISAAPRLGGRPSPPARRASALLVAEDVDVVYRDAGLQAVHSASLVLKRAETVALVGESGSGKSSLVRSLLGLVPAAGGQLELDGQPLAPALADRRPAVRRRLSMVFQDPLASLNPQMRVRDIVREPVRRAGPSEILAALERVGLGAEFLDRFPHQLSGGQAQRVAIARALITGPDVLVCDEAVAALDGTIRQQIIELLERLQAETGLSIIFIAHDLAIVEGLSHRVVVMYLGRVVEEAPAAELFAAPAHPYTRALLDAVPEPDPTSARHTALRGEVPSPVSPPEGCAFNPRCPHAIARCRVELPALRNVGGRYVACHRFEELSAG